MAILEQGFNNGNLGCFSSNFRKKKGKLISLIIDHRIRNESFFESKRVEKYLNQNHIETKLFKIKKQKVTKKNMKEARDNRFDQLIIECKLNCEYFEFL